MRLLKCRINSAMRVVGVEPLLEVTLKYGALHIVLPI